MNQFDHFAAWLATPLGQYLAAAEAAWFDRVASDIFGYHAVQFELPQIDCLRQNRIAWRARAGRSGSVGVRCLPEQLPFGEQSLDLLALPHVLDFAADPHAVLREAQRVLVPDGRLLITGFNPWSLWGLRQGRARLYQRLGGGGQPYLPDVGEFISPGRLRDWLRLMFRGR